MTGLLKLLVILFLLPVVFCVGALAQAMWAVNGFISLVLWSLTLWGFLFLLQIRDS